MLMIATAFFSVCLAIGPEQDMVAHTTPFMMLILCLPGCFVVAILEHMYTPQGKTMRMKITAGVVFTFCLSSAFKVTLSFLSIGGMRATKLAQSIDYLWTVLVLSVPFMVPQPSSIYQLQPQEPQPGDIVEISMRPDSDVSVAQNRGISV